MKKFLKNDKGSVLVMSTAIIVCIVSAFSAVSLLGMIRNDQLQTQYDHESRFQRTKELKKTDIWYEHDFIMLGAILSPHEQIHISTNESTLFIFHLLMPKEDSKFQNEKVFKLYINTQTRTEKLNHHIL